MAIKLKIGGGGSTSTKKAAAKPKASTAKKNTAKPAAKKGSTAKKTTPRKNAAQTRARAQSQSSANKASDAVVRQFSERLTKAGKEVKETQAKHAKAVDNVAKIVQQARDKNVPMAVIVQTTGISRQWLYKMNDTQKRQNGNSGSAGAKASSSKPAAKTAAKSGSSRPRIRVGGKR